MSNVRPPPPSHKMKKALNPVLGSSKIVFEDSEEEEEEEEIETASFSSSSDEEEEKESDLANLTLEELQKVYSDRSHSVHQKPNLEKNRGRANKNQPMEVSCKKPVSRFREVVHVPKKVIRDPRFDSLSGKLDVNGFRKRYDFLYKEILPAEREDLKKQLKKTRDPEVIGDLKERISSIDRELKHESAKGSDAAILAEHKKKEREAAKQGKKPYYLKNTEIRKQSLMEKYNNLKASGKLESFIEKRRKKNAAKDQRFMPYGRPDNVEQ